MPVRYGYRPGGAVAEEATRSSRGAGADEFGNGNGALGSLVPALCQLSEDGGICGNGAKRI